MDSARQLAVCYCRSRRVHGHRDESGWVGRCQEYVSGSRWIVEVKQFCVSGFGAPRLRRCSSTKLRKRRALRDQSPGKLMAILEQIDDLLFNLEMTSAAPVGRTGSKDNKGPKSSQKAAVTLSAGSEVGAGFSAAILKRCPRSQCAQIDHAVRTSRGCRHSGWSSVSGRR